MTIPQGLLMKPGQGTSLSIVGDVLTFKAVSEDTDWYMPAGVERFFAEVGVEVDHPDAPSVPATPATIERVLAAAPKYGRSPVTSTPVVKSEVSFG